MSLRILVVGRDAHAREGLKSILSSDGHDVDVAQDIWEGFARVAAKEFDLLLLDDDVRLNGHAAMIVADLLAFARLQHRATCGIVISSFAAISSSVGARISVRSSEAIARSISRARVRTERGTQSSDRSSSMIAPLIRAIA